MIWRQRESKRALNHQMGFISLPEPLPRSTWFSAPALPGCRYQDTESSRRPSRVHPTDGPWTWYETGVVFAWLLCRALSLLHQTRPTRRLLRAIGERRRELEMKKLLCTHFAAIANIWTLFASIYVCTFFLWLICKYKCRTPIDHFLEIHHDFSLNVVICVSNNKLFFASCKLRAKSCSCGQKDTDVMRISLAALPFAARCNSERHQQIATECGDDYYLTIEYFAISVFWPKTPLYQSRSLLT